MPLKQLSSARRPDSFDPRSVPGLALWLDGADTSTLYTTDAGPVTAVTAPTDISGCVGWWDASDAATLFAADTGSTLATTTVGRWANKGTMGSAADLLQATAGSRPTISAGALAGKNTLTFDGTSDTLRSGSLSLTNTLTYILVMRFESDYAGVASRIVDAGAAGVRSGEFLLQSANTLALYGGTTASGVTLPAGAYRAYGVYAAQFSSTDPRLTYSGASITLSGTTTGANTGSRLTVCGDSSATPGQLAHASIAELCVFSSTLSAADRARVEAYLALKWGISGVHAQATATSDPVGQWRDKSGNGRNVIQSVGSARPSLRAATINGKRSVDFDGVDDTLWVTPSVTSGDLTALCVYRYDTLNGGVVYDVAHQGDSTNAQRSESTGFLNSIGMLVSAAGLVTHRLDRIRSFVETQGGRSSVAGAYSAGRVALSSAAASHETNTDRYGGLDGASLTQTTRFNGGAWSAISIGARRNSTPVSVGSVFLDGQVCEFLLYERNLSQSQRQRIEQYLAAKWGITLSPQVANADAQDWINRVYANGGQVSSSTASAVNTLCNSIDAAGIRDRFFRMGIFAGSNLAAALVPLYRGPSLGGTQYGNATDTNVGPFVSGDYFEQGSSSGGLTGNGSTKYLSTGLADNVLPQNDSHISAYDIVGAASTFRLSIGARTTSNTGCNLLGTWANASFVGFLGFESASVISQVSGARAGHYIGSINGANAASLYRNGLLQAASTSTTRTPGATQHTVFALNTGGTVGSHTSGRIGAYSLGLKFTDAQALAYYEAMQAFQAALGRNV